MIVELLYCDDIIQGPNTLFRVLRDYSVLKGFKIQQHSKSNTLTHGIANLFFTSHEDCDFAFERLFTMQTSVANTAIVKQNGLPAVATFVYCIGREHDDELKLAHNVS